MINAEEIKWMQWHKCLGYMDRKSNRLVRIETRIHGEGIKLSMYLDQLNDEGKKVGKNLHVKEFAIESSITDMVYSNCIQAFLREYSLRENKEKSLKSGMYAIPTKF